MATGTYIGNTSYRVVNELPMEDSRGVDTLQVTLRGDLDDYDTTFDSWTRGKVATSLGYSNMYLQQKRGQKGGSNFGTIDLQFWGFLTSTESNPIGTTSDVVLQSTTLVSDENDSNGDAQNVQVSYYTDQTITRWIYRGLSAPTGPRYPLTVPNEVANGILFNHYPASYTGTLLKKHVGRLTGFSREELSTGVWGVVETWVNRVEPDSE